MKWALSFALLLLMTGCRQDMHNQPRYKPLAASNFFANGMSARQVPEGTVARGAPGLDAARYVGSIDGEDVAYFPFTVNRSDVDRGRERFNIFCAPCHGRLGEGNGMVVKRGYRKAGNYHEERLVKAPVGHFFDVITNGFGAMPSYGARVEADDRWRIIAYIRVLQISARATVDDVPEQERRLLQESR